MSAKGISNLSLASNIQTFSGECKENLNFFLQNIDQVARLEKWSGERKFLILKLNLTGKALDFVSNNPKAENITDFENLAKLLREKFSSKVNFSELQNKFSTIKQRPNQSVDNLVEEVSNITDKYVGINKDSVQDSINLANKLKAQKLIDALRSDIKIDIIKQGLSDFQEIARAAKNIENALNCSESEYAHNIVKSSGIDFLLKAQIENNKQIQELAKKLDSGDNKTVNNVECTSNNTNVECTSNNTNRDKIQCHICGKPHWTTKCWYYPTNRHNSQFKAKFRMNRGNYRSNYRGNRFYQSRFPRYNNNGNNLN